MTVSKPHSIQDDFSNVREAMSRYNGRGSYEERRLWFEEGTLSLQRIEEQYAAQERELTATRIDLHHKSELLDFCTQERLGLVEQVKTLESELAQWRNSIATEALCDENERLKEQLQTAQNVLAEERRWHEESRDVNRDYAGRLEDALHEAERLKEQLEALQEKPDQPLLNAARRLVKATDNAERNYALADLVVALEGSEQWIGDNSSSSHGPRSSSGSDSFSGTSSLSPHSNPASRPS